MSYIYDIYSSWNPAEKAGKESPGLDFKRATCGNEVELSWTWKYIVVKDSSSVNADMKMQQQDCWFSPKSICKHLGTTIRTRIRSYSNDPLMLSSAPAWVRERAPGRSVEGVSYFRCLNHSRSQNCDLRTWGSQLERWDVSVHQTCQTVWHMSNIVQQHCKHPITSHYHQQQGIHRGGSHLRVVMGANPAKGTHDIIDSALAAQVWSSTTRQSKKTQKSLEVGVRFSQSSQKYWMCWVVENQNCIKLQCGLDVDRFHLKIH